MFCGGSAADSAEHLAEGLGGSRPLVCVRISRAVAPRLRIYPLWQFTINWGDSNLAEIET